MAKIVTFGEILLRLSPPGHERLLQSPLLHVNFGGGEANVAVSLGMALHELATNALKHGAWAGAGRVDIEVSAEAGEARIVWRESQGRRISPPQSRGFGSRLLERGVARELGGSVVLDFPESGLVCTIRAPLSDRLYPAAA